MKDATGGGDVNFGETLAKLRSEKGVYQKELAAALNVSVGTVSNYEKGVHFPDLATLCKIADYFDVTTDYLLSRTRYRYNFETLNRRLLRDYTVADMVNTTLELSPRDVYSMLDFLELLKLRSSGASKDE